jgi:hypothetical protein
MIDGATVTAPLTIPKLYNGKDRTFWTFGWERTDNSNVAPATYTVPTVAEKQGDFSTLLAAGSIYQIYNPFTTAPAANGRYQRQPFPGNVIPKSLLDPIAQKILGYYPNPNQPGTIDGQQNYFLLSNNWGFVNRNILNRVDHVISDKHRLFVRWNNAQFDQATSTLDTPIDRNKIYRPGWGGVLNDVYVFNPQLLLNVRWGFTCQDTRNYGGSQGFDLTSLGFSQSLVNQVKAANNPAGITFPQTTIDGAGFTSLGQAGGSDTKTYFHDIAATVTKISGSHSLKFGADFRIQQQNAYNFGNVSPSLTFAQAYTRGPMDNAAAAPIGQGLASLLVGIPTAGGIDINASMAEESTFWGLYVQDDWRVTPRLTVNLGLRYEIEGPTTDRFNRSIRGFDFGTASPISAQAKANYALNPNAALPVNQFQTMGGLTFAGVNGQPRGLWNIDKNNFGPRVGMAYQLDPKTVIRAGYGIFYTTTGVDMQDVNQGGFSQTTNLIASNNNGQSYQATLANPFPFGLQAPQGASAGLSTFLGRAVSFFNANSPTPYIQRWSLSVERQLPGRILLETSYVGNRGTKLPVTRQFDAMPAQYLSKLPYRDQPTINYLTALVPNPFYGIPAFAGSGLGNQTVAQSTLLTPYPQFSGITASVPTGYSYFHSLQTQAEKRMSGGLTFQASWNWSKFMEATAYQNATDPVPAKVISGADRTHRLAVTTIYALPVGKGRPFLANARPITDGILGGWQLQGIYEGQTGAPLGFGNAIFNGDLHNVALPVDQRRVERWFNTDAGFNRNAAQQLASNIQTFPARFSCVRSDGINNFQLSAYKYFSITERFRLRFMLMGVNALNHPQFGAPNTTPTSSLFGTITSTASAREVHWGLKLLF